MRTLFCYLLLAGTIPAAPHPMSFRDVLEIRTLSQGRLSHDGKQFCYVLSSLNWQQGRRSRSIYVREADGAARQIAPASGSDDSDPLFSPDDRRIGFLSDRNGAVQVYLAGLSGGDARRVSDVSGGVASYGFSGDGKSMVFLGGRDDHRQLYLHDIAGGRTSRLAPQSLGITRWSWSADSRRIYFLAPGISDPFDQMRIDQRFDIQIADVARPPLRLWEVNIATGALHQVPLGNDLSVRAFTISRLGNWIGFTAARTARYLDERDEEAYLFHVESGKVERLTDNHVPETTPEISPDEQWVAFSASEDFVPFRRHRIYVRSVRGGAMRAVPRDWDGEARDVSWSGDSRELYFDDGVGLNQHLFAANAATGRIRQLTERMGEVHATYLEDLDRFLVSYQSPAEPPDYYLASLAEVGHRDHWKRLTDANPQVRDFALGAYDQVRWESSDGRSVEGILVKPLDYVPGRRYPLIVQVHGGPAGAYTNSFSNSWATYVHVFAAAGYLVFQPNYRGSTNYGETFRMQIAGDYFRLGFDDIMSGVDQLVAAGIADPDRMGMMGWSAGGHWSNWTLTHTDRFKAISSGAGAANWVSMYAETDAQDTREFYFHGTPYDNWDQYLEMSPLRHIRNAKTPTLIHAGEDDTRVPKPQGDELYTALKKLGVPAEMVVYPRMGHNITEPRLQMAKMVLEFNWFEKWLRGRAYWITWRDLVDTVPREEPRIEVSSRREHSHSSERPGAGEDNGSTRSQKPPAGSHRRRR